MNVVRLFIIVSFFSWFPGSILFARSQALNIGLLIPDQASLAARHGAELAIREANEKGGYQGKPFHLVVRSVKGMWGTGSKQSVSLIFDDHVLALTGSLDGRNAHLAEQVATKTKVAFVSTWATDMTLSYAFVPWYFRCIPDDKIQATLFIQEIYNKKKIRNVSLIGLDTYDARKAMATFSKVTNSLRLTQPRQFIVKSSGQDLKKMFLNKDILETGAFVLFGDPAFASTFMTLYQQKNMNQPVFGTISLLDDQKAHTPNWEKLDQVVTVSSDQWFTKKGIAFQKKFSKIYGYQPGPVAAYAYDAVSVIIEAVRKTGTNRDNIIETLSKIHYQGTTGEIRFDEKGNRSGETSLMILKNGVPFPLKGHE